MTARKAGTDLRHWHLPSLSTGTMSRHKFTPLDTVKHVWTTLGLPKHALQFIHLPIDAECGPSSFKVGHLAQASIGLSALSAALLSSRNGTDFPSITVPSEHAYVEFKSERLYELNGKAGPSTFGTIGGLHKTRDGHIRMHDGFPNHRENALRVLGLLPGAKREEVSRKMQEWHSVDLETEAIQNGAVMAALRSFGGWDALPQSSAISDFPISVSKLAEGSAYLTKFATSAQAAKCLHGIRVLEMSRVIAAPVAGKTLAAYGAVSDRLAIGRMTTNRIVGCDVDHLSLTARSPRYRHRRIERQAHRTARHQAA